MSHPKALVADPSPALHQGLRKFLEGAGFRVMGVRYFDEAVIEVAESEPELLFTSVSHLFDGEALCRKIKEVAPGCPVVLVYPPEVEDPDSAAAAAGADATLVAPLKRGTVVSCARTMMQLRSLRHQVDRLESDLKRHVAEPPADALQDTGTSADFAFFKKFLLMEVKRSRRYKYPVSFLLIGLDHFTEKTHEMKGVEKSKVLTEALSLITRGVRDIDLVVPFSEGRFLAFLPHTPRDGAAIVAVRARERLAKMEKGRGITCSIGVASFEPGPNMAPVSFGSLMKDATEALRKAQTTGGNKIEGGARVKRDRISMG